MTGNRNARFPQWALGIISVVTILAIAILVLSVVLGVRAGQTQLEFQRRQQVGIALQNAIDHRSIGDLQEALAEYQRVLLLDPGNTAAVEGIEHLFELAAGGASLVSAITSPVATPAAPGAAANISVTTPVAQPLAAVNTPNAAISPTLSAVSATSTITATPRPNPELDALLSSAQTAFRAGRWQETIDSLLQVQQRSITYKRQDTEQLLFNAYINLAAEKDNEDNLETALALYDKALALNAVPEVASERDLVNAYLEVLTYYGADWERAIELLAKLYGREPGYRDVEARLETALIAYGDSLGEQNEWCDAADQYDAATALTSAPTLMVKRQDARTLCENGGVVSTATISGELTPSASVTPTLAGAATRAAPTPETPVAARPPSGAPIVGHLLYSARDPLDGRTRIFGQPASGGAATIVLEDASQPALRPDGQRLVYHNLRSDMAGLSAIDPATGVQFRVTEYAEDMLPDWNPQGSRVVFASNREGDRRWRIYAAWAEQGGGVNTLFFGESPAWHPSMDLIAHRGCDPAGNTCGLWLMDSAGGNRSPLTTVIADDRPHVVAGWAQRGLHEQWARWQS
jgi:tetratricopeptide (TPR) repeat protein